MSSKISNNDKILIEHETLKKEIDRYNFEYYTNDNSLISDYEYDMLYKKLKELEKTYNFLYIKDSPTQYAGDKRFNKNFEKAQHLTKMYSLNNTYNEKDIKNFLKATDDTQYLMQEKIDGMSLELVYKQGKLYKAITRGNGVIGEDVTKNALCIKDIPVKIPNTDTVIIRGEVFIKKSQFNKLNEINVNKNNQKPFANCRNLASGTMKNLDTNIVRERSLSFIAYYYNTAKSNNLETDDINILKEYGFTIPHMNNVVSDYKPISKIISDFETEKNSLDYDTDGIVIKCNTKQRQRELGYSDKAPVYSVAYKYPAQKVKTRLISIEYQIGRTGVITPVATVEAVEISGSVVSKASLYNFDEIKRLGIKINDYVDIVKSAEIIPKIVSNYPNERIDTSDIILPENCPCCNSKLVQYENEVNFYCTNNDCPEKQIQKLIYFVSKDAMDIKGLSEQTIRQFYNENIVKTYVDILNLPSKALSIVKLDGFSTVKVNNITKAVIKSYDNEHYRLLNALSVKYVGKVLAKKLFDTFKTFDNIKNATVDDFLKIELVSDIIANSLYNTFNDIDFVNTYNECETFMNENKIIAVSSEKLLGKSFCITGTFDITRTEIESIVQSNSGIIRNSVSKKLDYLIVGENPGSKLQKANDNNVKIITLQDLYNMIQ